MYETQKPSIPKRNAVFIDVSTIDSLTKTHLMTVGLRFLFNPPSDHVISGRTVRSLSATELWLEYTYSTIPAMILVLPESLTETAVVLHSNGWGRKSGFDTTHPQGEQV
jgi:hypothetical protein